MTFTAESDGPYKISRNDWNLALYHASSKTILRVLRLFQHAAHCVLLMNGKLFLFININFHIFLCQSPRRPAQVFSELHGGRAGPAAAETGSFRNDCRPQCTLGNNQPSFVIIAGKYSSRGLGRPRSRTPAAAVVQNHFSLMFIKRAGAPWFVLGGLLGFREAEMKRASRGGVARERFKLMSKRAGCTGVVTPQKRGLHELFKR